MNGQLEEEVTLVAGVRQGPNRAWNAQCGLVSEGAFADGKPDGRWRSWRADGALVSETVYVEGVVVSAVRGMQSQRVRLAHRGQTAATLKVNSVGADGRWNRYRSTARPMHSLASVAKSDVHTSTPPRPAPRPRRSSQ